VSLAHGVTQQASSVSSNQPLNSIDTSFLPQDVTSVATYNLKDPKSFWSELNAVVSSHSDVVGAIASRPLLQGLLQPYGIRDAGWILRRDWSAVTDHSAEPKRSGGVGRRTFDQQSLKKIAAERLGANPKRESVGEAEMLVSTIDNWGAAFVDKYFMTGPA
jgi:hypothetical protein